MGSDFGFPTVIGFHGSLTSSLLERPGERSWGWAVGQMTSHDAAAVLVHGGKIGAAIEEERLSRVKHTNRLPVHAIQACLEIAGVPLEAVDRIAYYTSESWLGDMVQVKHRSLRGHRTPRAFIAATLERELGSPIDPIAWRSWGTITLTRSVRMSWRRSPTPWSSRSMA